jgi:hypothetical protein
MGDAPPTTQIEAKEGCPRDSDVIAKASVAGAEVHRMSVAQALKDIREAAEDAERLLTIDGHATEKT